MAIEHGDGGRGEPGDPVADRAHPERHRRGLLFGAQRAEFLEVAARDERAVAGTRHNQRPGPVSPVKRLLQLIHRLQRDGVAGMRPVDGDDRQAVVELEVDHQHSPSAVLAFSQ